MSQDIDGAREFWSWLASRRTDLEEILSGHPNDELIDAVHRRVGLLNGSTLGWEIGPGLVAEYQFTLSPNGDRERLKATRRIVGEAPRVPDWEFHYAKPPKSWTVRLIELSDGSRMCFDDWCYSLQAFNDHEFFDIDLYPPVRLEKSQARKLDILAYLCVEGELGEELLVERIGVIRAHTSPERADCPVGSIEGLRSHLASFEQP